MGLIQMFCIHCYVYRKILASWTLCEKGRSGCQAISQIFIFEVAGPRTMARDRGKFQARKTAMAAPCFFTRNVEKRIGRRHRSFTQLEFSPIPYPRFRSLHLQKSISREPLNIWICPFHTGSRTPTFKSIRNIWINPIGHKSAFLGIRKLGK